MPTTTTTNLPFTAVLMLLATSGILDAETQRVGNNLEFRAPTGWQVNRTENGAVLMPPDAVAGSEAYLVALLPGVTDVQDPKLLSKLAAQYSSSDVHAASLGQPAPFRAAGGMGFVHSYDFAENGQQGRLQFYLVPLRNGGVAAVVAAGTRNMVPARAATMLAVASSLDQSLTVSAAKVPHAGGVLANQWNQRLSGKKLMQFSSYSSGSSGGYSSERTLVLAADGTYAYRSSSSVSIYVPGANGGSSGRNGSEGRWRVYEQGGQAMLELQSERTGREEIVLTTDGSKTFLNGHRWMVAPLQ